METNGAFPKVFDVFKAALMILACLVSSGCAGGLLEGFLGETRIVFYGQVVDQHGRPVEGAKVIYEVENFSFLFSRYRAGSVRTGKDGKFRIRDGRGSQLFIEDISIIHGEYPVSGPKLAGYEYRSYYTDCFRPDKKKPEVFTIRRKETEAVYLYKNTDIHFELPAAADGVAEERWRGWDLCGGDCIEPRFKSNPQYYFDIEFTWEHDAERGEWTLHVKANGENAGFQLRDEKLYTAPEDGYVKERTFRFGYSEELPLRHVYLRLRDPGVYARLDVLRASASGNRVYVKCDEYINPYGDRCLEPLEFLLEDNSQACEAHEKCIREAELALIKHRLAPRPPFEEWIRKGLVRY